MPSLRPTQSFNAYCLSPTYPCEGFLLRTHIMASYHAKEKARAGRLRPPRVPHEVGQHGRRTSGRPPEASNATLYSPARPARAPSFKGQSTTAQLRATVAIHLYVTTLTFRLLPIEMYLDLRLP